MEKVISEINQQLAAQGKGPFQWKTIPQGAATSVWAAVVAPADEIGGRYCENCHVGERVPGKTNIPHHCRQRRRTRICARREKCRSALEEK